MVKFTELNGVSGVMSHNMRDGKKVYCAGFLVHGDGVLMVRKNRPKWQAGYLNGIGGELKPNEEAHDAMVREFEEETGVRIEDWTLFVNEEGPGYEVYFFKAIAPKDFTWDRSKTTNDVGEELCWQPLGMVREPMIGNLHWILPLIRDPREIIVLAKTTSDIRTIATW